MTVVHGTTGRLGDGSELFVEVAVHDPDLVESTVARFVAAGCDPVVVKCGQQQSAAYVTAVADPYVCPGPAGASPGPGAHVHEVAS